MSEAKVEAPQAGKKGKKKLVIIGALAAVLLAGGGGGAWYFLKPPAGDEEHAEAEVAKKGPPVFSPLDPFVVNLADDGGDRMAQVGVTLELKDVKTGDAIKEVMPAIRNGILLLISSKRSDELLTLAGKEKLAVEIAEVTGEHLGWSPEAEEQEEKKPAKGKAAKRAPPPPPNPVQAVHFAQFIIQ